jgi:hypothetical protein
MKDIEEQVKSAQFRADMINKYQYDPGPEGDQPDLFHYVVVFTIGFFMLKTWLSS